MSGDELLRASGDRDVDLIGTADWLFDGLRTGWTSPEDEHMRNPYEHTETPWKVFPGFCGCQNSPPFDISGIGPMATTDNGRPE